MRILIHDGPLQLFQQAFGWSRRITRLTLDAQRRNAQLVTDLQFVFGLAALFVDAHFALSDEPVNACTRHVTQVLEKEIIESLVELRSRNIDQANR